MVLILWRAERVNLIDFACISAWPRHGISYSTKMHLSLRLNLGWGRTIASYLYDQIAEEAAMTTLSSLSSHKDVLIIQVVLQAVGISSRSPLMIIEKQGNVDSIVPDCSVLYLHVQYLRFIQNLNAQWEAERLLFSAEFDHYNAIMCSIFRWKCHQGWKGLSKCPLLLRLKDGRECTAACCAIYPSTDGVCFHPPNTCRCTHGGCLSEPSLFHESSLSVSSLSISRT